MPPRSETPQSLALGAACLGLWAAWATARWWGHWPSDLSALYFAARFYAEGAFAEVYSSPARFFGTDYPESWQAAATALGHAGEQTFPYIYPPLWAALLAPVAQRVSPDGFFHAVYLWHIALLALAPVLAWRIMRPTLGFGPFAAISAALMATSVITDHALFQNQPQITVVFLTLLAFERALSGRPTAAGIALGVAAALKLSPLVLLVIFAIERKWRTVWTCLATTAALGALSVLIAGPDLHRAFLDKLRILSDQLVIWDLNFSLKAALFQVSEFLAGRRFPAATDAALLLAPPVWLGWAVTTTLMVGAILIWLATRNAPEPARLRHRLAAGSLLAILCAPLSWSHHSLIALFLVPGLFGALPRPRATAVVAAFGLLYAGATIARLPTLFPLNSTVLFAVAGMACLTAAFALSAPPSAAARQPAARKGDSGNTL